MRSLLARLVIVYSGAIDASDNNTLLSRNIETPYDAIHAVQDANFGRTSPYQKQPLQQDHISNRPGQAPTWIRTWENSSAFNHLAKLRPKGKSARTIYRKMSSSYQYTHSLARSQIKKSSVKKSQKFE